MDLGHAERRQVIPAMGFCIVWGFLPFYLPYMAQNWTSLGRKISKPNSWSQWTRDVHTTKAQTQDHLQHFKTQWTEKDFQQLQSAREDCENHDTKKKIEKERVKVGVSLCGFWALKRSHFLAILCKYECQKWLYLKKMKARVITWLQEPGL